MSVSPTSPRITICQDPIQKAYNITQSPLGVGVGGRVLKIQHRNSGETFALKALRNTPKAKREIELHARCSTSPNVVKIVEIYENTWEGSPHILLVLEHMKGGELFERISANAEHGFTETEASTIVRQLALGIRDLHRMGIAHRDLKPENFLYSGDYKELKICDFGFAKQITDEALSTPLYTPYYVAPEVLNVKSQISSSYDKACDLWSLGVICYIMPSLAGYPPFYSLSQQQSRLTPGMERRIQTGDYDFDDEAWDNISTSAKDLVRCLLVIDPKQRLNIDQALKHPWLMSSDARPKTPLKLPKNLLDSPDLWAEAQDELASALTSMRVSDNVDTMKPLTMSGSSLLAKRRGGDQQQAKTRLSVQLSPK